MSISIEVLIISAITLILIILSIYVYKLKKSLKKNDLSNQHSIKKDTDYNTSENSDSMYMTNEVEVFNKQEKNGLIIHNESNDSIILCANEIISLPKNSVPFTNDGNVLDKLTNITTDILGKSMSIPNKSIQIVFKPEIQKGLSDGTYKLMQTNNGEILADVVHSGVKGLKGQIVGKGRIIETGKVKQIGMGAFQIASIIVAQSHMADIQKSLVDLKQGIESIKKILDNDFKSKIEGSYEYLKSIIEYIESQKNTDDISSEKRHEVEVIIHSSYEWNSKLKTSMENVIDEINSITNNDWFGTADISDKFKSALSNLPAIVEQYNALLKLYSTIAYIKACKDPFDYHFTKIIDHDKKLVDLFDKLVKTVKKRGNELFNAFWNEQKTLDSRKSEIIHLATINFYEINTMHNEFENSIIKLNDSIKNKISNKDIKIALKFDSLGQVENAVIV